MDDDTGLLEAATRFLEFLHEDSLECHACWNDWEKHDEDCELVRFEAAVRRAASAARDEGA